MNGQNIYRWLGGVALSLALSGSWASGQFDDPFEWSVSSVSLAGGELELSADVSIPEGHYLYAKDLSITLDAGMLTPVDPPTPIPKLDEFSGETVDVFKHDLAMRFRVDSLRPAGGVITVAYMGCNQQLCFMPQKKVYRLDPKGTVTEMSEAEATPEMPGPGGDDGVGVGDDIFAGLRLTGRASGYLSVDDFLGFVNRTEAGRGLEKGRLELLVAGRGIWIGILAILLGGLALNLTPCVLPMIPINLAIIGAGAQAGSRVRGFVLGAVYGIGIAVVYGVLGVVVVLTGAQFGELNASPWFNLGIAALFVVLSLAMLGAFNLDLTRLQPAGFNAKAKGPFLTALLFGGVAALLAGACVAPVVISVLVLSTELYQRGNTGALLLPFVLGVGMALPWPLAGAGLSLLPKPGRWMERVKIGFGVVILVMAFYYGYLGVSLLHGSSVNGGNDAVEEAGGFWHSSPVAALEEARQTGRPLMVDFWATWCKNCKAMEATTFKDATVRKSLEPYVRLKFQAENLSEPAVKQILESLGIRGLPAYVVLEQE